MLVTVQAEGYSLLLLAVISIYIHSFIRNQVFKISARKYYTGYWEEMVQRERKESGYSVRPL